MIRVNMSDPSAEEYIGATVTERFGLDISADTYEVGFAADRATTPTDWFEPTVVVGTVPSSAEVKVLLTQALVSSHSLDLGQVYYLKSRIHDSPEVLPRVLCKFIMF